MNKVSVIIPTRNRARMLEKCLQSLVNQSVLPYEVIVSDNNSTDDTRTVIAKYKKKLNLIYVFTEEKGISKTRNNALNKITGEIIAFIDDDCVAFHDWIENINKNKSLLKNHYILGFNYNQNYKNTISNYVYLAVLADVLKNIYQSDKMLKIDNYLDTKNAVISIDQYDRLKPLFNEKFDLFHFGEDRELGIRLTSLGYQGIVKMDIRIAHHFITSLKQFIKKRFFAGRSIIANKDILDSTIKKNFPINTMYEKYFTKEIQERTLKAEKNKAIKALLNTLQLYSNSNLKMKIQFLILFILDNILLNSAILYQTSIINLKK